MHEWRRYSIRQLVGAPISGKRPTGGVSAETDGIPSLGGENIRADGGMDYGTINRVPVEFFRSMPKGRLQASDVLINKDGAQTGKVGLYDGRFDEAAVNEHVFILRSSSGAIDQRLLYYFLLLPDTQLRIARRITGSAQPGLNSQFADAVHLTVPSERAEQCRIAEILSTVDEAIEQTEALIAKMQQIKAGLMSDLFTRGVTADGQLRPHREEAPQLYKESPLGPIPNEWDLKACSEICLSVIDCKNRTPPVTEDGHPVIRTPNVRDGEFVWTDLAYTDPISYVEWTKRGRPVAGDIVITREAPVGEVCIIPRELEAPCLGQRMMLYRPDPNQVLGSFLVQVLQSIHIRKHLDVISGGSTVGHVRVGDIRSLRVPWAPMPEQEAIASRLDCVREQLTNFRAEALKLRQIKAALMHDLLAGRAPVVVDDAPVPRKVAANV